MENGGLGQAKDKQPRNIEMLPKELKEEIFKKLETQDMISVYRAFNQKHETLSLLDNEKRQEVIKKVDFNDLVEHCNTLKTRNERKELFGWLNPDKATALCRCFMSDTNRLKKFLGELDFEQIVELYNNFKEDHEKKKICRAIPLNHLEELKNRLNLEYQKIETIYKGKEKLSKEIAEDLKKLDESKDYWEYLDANIYRGVCEQYTAKFQEKWDLNLINWREKFDRAREVLNFPTQELSIRLDAENFNALTRNERKVYVRELKPKQIVDLLEYFVDDPNKQKKICKAMHFEDFKSLANQSDTFKRILKLLENTKRINILGTNDKKRGYIESLPPEEVADVYLDLKDDPNKQKKICRLITLKCLKNFVEHLNFEESEVARSCLKEWNGM